ncbi:universal stress protein [Salinirubellus sp. GCM10025818]|uniref:universal stress protein n=1 Tax=Salinirubellus TaxID=2162630 RepID=UPI0030D545E4
MAEQPTHENVLVPTDGSRAARRAAEQAVALVRGSGGTVHALYVMDMGDADFVASPSDIAETRERLEEKGGEFVAAVEELTEEAGVECVTEVRTGIPEEEIVEYAHEQDVDFIVMGKRGRSDPDKPMIGSTTRRVIGRSDVPVRSV